MVFPYSPTPELFDNVNVTNKVDYMQIKKQK